MRSPRTDASPPGPWPAPDVTITDGHGLKDLLQKAL
jgi:hypothetical protein